MSRSILLTIAGFSLCTLAACQSVSTAGGYKPDNCGMVGSSCSRDR